MQDYWDDLVQIKKMKDIINENMPANADFNTDDLEAKMRELQTAQGTDLQFEAEKFQKFTTAFKEFAGDDGQVIIDKVIMVCIPHCKMIW